MENNLHQAYKHIYFLGIGGISMSGLAEILLNKGFQVSGSDMKQSPNTNHLESLGISVKIGHRSENITDDIDLLVYTAAVKAYNPEYIEAKRKNIKIIDRAELLGQVMKGYRHSIAVSGTHGKTTTTSMISEILLHADTDPTISIGGILPSIHGNTRVGNSSYFVAEACEYFDSFLKFNPFVCVVLNVEADHLDYFKDIHQIEASFRSFMHRVPEDGFVIINKEIPSLPFLTEGLKSNLITFGLDLDCTWSADNIIHEPNGRNSFDIFYCGKKMGRVSLNVPGEHNIKNALAACASMAVLDIPIEKIIKGLSSYQGAERRFQLKGKFQGVTVVDDYGHHPTEIKATLAAAKNVEHNKIWCVFQPHTYTRTKLLLANFAKAFSDADKIIIADIYAAREKDTGEISAQTLVEKIKEEGKDAYFLGSFEQIEKYLQHNCEQGDLLITMGAGDVYLIGEDLVKN